MIKIPKPIAIAKQATIKPNRIKKQTFVNVGPVKVS